MPNAPMTLPLRIIGNRLPLALSRRWIRFAASSFSRCRRSCLSVMPFARKHKVSLQANTVSRVSGVIGLSFPVFGSLQGRQLKSASSTTTEDGRRPSARLVVLTAAISARRVTGTKCGWCSIVPIPAKESKIEGAQLNGASTSMVVTASCSICFQTAKGYRSPKSVLQ